LYNLTNHQNNSIGYSNLSKLSSRVCSEFANIIEYHCNATILLLEYFNGSSKINQNLNKNLQHIYDE